MGRAEGPNEVPPASPEERGGDILELIDQAGDRHDFRFQDVYDLDGVTYYLVEPVEASPPPPALVDGSDRAFLLKETPGGLELMEGEDLEDVIARLQEDEQPAPSNSTPPTGREDLEGSD